MTYARLCEHGEVNPHKGTGYVQDGRWRTVNPGLDCPGGSVLPDDTVERAWWCKANRALRTAPGICNREIALHPQCRWVTIIQEPQWYPSSVLLRHRLPDQEP